MLSKLIHKAKTFRDDREGSEAVEMVAITAMLVTCILVGLLILSYAMVLNNVNFATKRVCREIEVTGKVDQTALTSYFENMLGSTQLINKTITVSDVTLIENEKIQLLDTFRVTGSCDYIIQLINPGSFTGYRITLPVTTTVSGMSEVYWSSQ